MVIVEVPSYMESIYEMVMCFPTNKIRLGKYMHQQKSLKDSDALHTGA
jgi:hypothetical protein